MTDPVNRDALTLKRWSQRKLAAARAAQSPVAPETAAPTTQPTPPNPPAPSPAAADAPATALPPVESLTIDSDFTAFMQPEIDEELKRGALRKLFSDPRFNVMDGLDVYIDDYSKPDPIPADLVRQLVQARYIFDPPATRVTADGHVEDVPSEPSDASDVAAPDGGELPAPAPAEPLASAGAPTELAEAPAEQPTPPLAHSDEAESR